MDIDYLIVGAGFAGSVTAERLAKSGHSVHLIDKRDHIGGNAFDELDENGVLVHRYGPHIFHTNSDRIYKYISQFTEWRQYEHRVLAKVGALLVPIPINRTTINELYNLNLDETGVHNFFEEHREPRNPINSSEDLVVDAVGTDLFNKFYRGYTKKMWGIDARELNASVASRIPIRTNSDDRYFSDEHQYMPKYGYTKLFENLLKNPKISVELSVDFFEFRSSINAKHIIYTGPIDRYFDYCYGKLPYRSLYFDHKHLANTETFQKTGTINYPNDYDYTRITEFKHLTGQTHSGTSLVYEYPRDKGDPYYPIPEKKNHSLYKKYKILADNEKNVSFIGRLATYKYYNMDQVIGSALSLTDKLLAGQ